MKVKNLFKYSKRRRFEVLVKPYLHDLYVRAYRLTSSRQTAEDLVQELLINQYSKDRDLSALEDVRSWLMRSLYNLCVDYWRKQQKNPLNNTDSIDLEGLENVTFLHDSPSENYQNQNTLSRVEAALDQLNPEHRILIVMHDMEGYTLNELVTEFATPVGTLKSRLHRARARLRKIWLEMEPSVGDMRVVK